MGVYEGRGQLNKAVKELTNRWLDTRAVWEDSRTEEFEKNFLQPMESDLRNAVAAMDHMAVLLSQVRRDCE
jgi:hypothetical protein